VITTGHAKPLPIYQRDGRRLLLMTCAVWDSEQRSYTRRLVVEAMLEAPADGHISVRWAARFNWR